MFSRLFHTNRHNIRIIANALIYVVLSSSFTINFNSNTISYNDSGNETVEKLNNPTKTESTTTTTTTTTTDIIVKINDAEGDDNMNEASCSNYDDEPYIYDKDWDERKTGCKFCNNFIQSPCNVQFQRWSKCIDDSKSKNEDYSDVCTKYTKALTDCCYQYTEYFSDLELFEKDDDSDEDDYDDFKEEGIMEEESSEEDLSESLETAIIIPPTQVLATTSNNTSENDVTINNEQSDK